MILPTTPEQAAAASVGAGPTARDSRTGARQCYAREAVMELLIRACGGIRPCRKNTITEALMATAADAADMLGGSCSWVFAAKQPETIKIGRSRHISVASTRHVAGQSAGVELVEPSTERSGESATPEKSEEVGDVLPA